MMLGRIHTFLGLDGAAPKQIKSMALPALMAFGFVVLGVKGMSVPEHVGFIEAQIVQIPTGRTGIIPGERFMIELPDGTQVSMSSSFRLPNAKVGDLVCINYSKDAISGRRKISTAIASKCSGAVTITTFSLT